MITDEKLSGERNHPAVSIIVPVFNSSRYLRECLDSLQKQSLTDIEILLINDGSTDHSEEICLEYCRTDGRFRYFCQENQGVSAARNTGIEKSQGEFIGFCDSDDWVDQEMYQKLYFAAKESNADFAITDFISEKKDGPVQRSYALTGGLHSGEKYQEYKRKLLVDDYFEYPVHISCWSFLCRKEIIKQNHLAFPPVTNGEDLLFGSLLAKGSVSMVYLDHAFLYHYRDTNNSASKNDYNKLKKSYSDLYRLFLAEFPTETEPEYEKQLLALRYQFLFILLGSLLSRNYSNRFIYKEFRGLLDESVFQNKQSRNKELDIKYSFNQKVQKTAIDFWDYAPVILPYLMLKRRKLRSG